MSQLIDNLNTIVSIKSDIKSAIENKGVDMTGVSFPDYASKIGEISGGGGVDPSGTLEISENGVYDVYSYSSASVDVHPSASLSETYISNGNYNITGEFNGGVITVDVPAPQFVTETLNVSANGTYNPGEGVDGYSQVVVDVPQSVTGFTEKEITEGTIEIINLDNSASFVAGYAFYNNKTIQTVNLPYATSVGQGAFQSCSSLSQISLPMCSYIGSWVFQSCSSLSQISLPMCSYIGQGAFSKCASLSQISLPMCSYIGSDAFNFCSSLLQVNLPVCSRIEGGGFAQCYSLTQISLPICSRIGNAAFQNCYSLSQVSLPVCEYIDNAAFQVCSSLSQVSLPMCRKIDYVAFRFCSSLSQVSLPVCSYIGNAAFQDCPSLSQVSLPVCSYIDLNVFYNCSSLSIITIGYSGICSLPYDAFDGTPIASGTGSIYVPASLVDAYKSAENWSYFSTQIFPI